MKILVLGLGVLMIYLGYTGTYRDVARILGVVK